MKVLVIGSGFEGMYMSYLLARDYGFDTQIVDPSPVFGSIMSGRQHGSFFLDYGCQVFDNFDPDITRNIQALGDDCCIGTSISYKSRYRGVTSDNMAVPDLSSCGASVVDRMLKEVQEASRADLSTGSDTLRDYYEKRWGATAAWYLEGINDKVFGMPSDLLDSNSRIYAGLSRIRIADDDRSQQLKNSSQALDDRIAVPRYQANTMYPEAMAELPFTNLHPTPESFAGYCRKARSVLARVGVVERLQTRVKRISKQTDGTVATLVDTRNNEVTDEPFDLLIWTGKLSLLESVLFESEDLKSLISPMGMHLFYHFARADQISDLGYFQNYDQDFNIFRWSSMGKYSAQTDIAGLSFCCTEIPDHKSNTDIGDNPDHQWEELRTLGLVNGAHAGDPLYLNAPNCYDRFLPGFSAAASKLMARIDTTYKNIIYPTPDVFGRVVAARRFHERIERML